MRISPGAAALGPASRGRWLKLLLAVVALLTARPAFALECPPGGEGMDPGAAAAFARWASAPGRPRLEAHCPLGPGLELAVVAAEGATGGGVYLVAAGNPEPTRVAGGRPTWVEPVRDRSGRAFAIVGTSAVAEATRRREYALVDLETREARPVLTGEDDAKSGGCGSSPPPSRAMATGEVTLKVEDTNGDGHPDVVLRSVMENCRSGALYRVTKTLVAVPRGFSETVQWTGDHEGH